MAGLMKALVKTAAGVSNLEVLDVAEPTPEHGQFKAVPDLCRALDLFIFPARRPYLVVPVFIRRT